MPLKIHAFAALAMMLGSSPSPSLAKAPTVRTCPYGSPSRWSELPPTHWIVLGRVVAVRSEFADGCCVGGDAEGSATLRIEHNSGGVWQRAPDVVFRWRSGWSDSEPYGTGLEPHRGDRLVVWSGVGGVGYTPASCLADLDQHLR
jgi:hypothetical protein